MKAIVYDRYGSADVLRLEEVEMPAPGEGEVLLRIHAASVNAADWHLMRGAPAIARLSLGLRKPSRTRLGADASGVVEAVGAEVTTLRVGDAVYGDVAGEDEGAFAEFAAVPVKRLVAKPATLTHEEAAAVPMAGVTALQALRDKAGVQAGEKVLINGAAGGVGAFAVQIAKAMGAEVTAVCSARNAEQAVALGADHVIDYAKQDFTATGARYDVILAANGYHPLRHYQRALTPTGTYVMTGGSNGQLFEAMLMGPLRSRRKGQRLSGLMATSSADDLRALSQMIEAGQVRPVIDRRYPLSETAEAVRYVEQGHARGKVVIVVLPA